MVESSFQKSEKEEKKQPRAKSTVNPENLNVAISETDDGKTCLYCDYPFEKVPDLAVVNEQTSNVFLMGGDFGKQGARLQYPIERDKIDIWKREEMTYFAVIDAEGAQDLYEISVAFINISEE